MKTMWSTTISWHDAKARANLIAQIRDFFQDRNVIEVETPSLSVGTVTDPFLDAFCSKYNFLQTSHIDQEKTYYLQTSPEFHMKRLLASGFGCIYQICKAFRHEGSGQNHNPEFTMLEWYRIGFNQHDLMAELDELLILILGTSQSQKISYQELFLRHISVDPLTASFDELYAVIKLHNKAADWLYTSNDSDLLLQFIFSEIIESNIGLDVPCFVYNFPVAQASLAQVCTNDHRVAKRFECYFNGIELANGFDELTDAKVQLNRFEQDNYKRTKLGLNVREIDENFISALQSGLPQCSGVALGVDRLMMLALKKNSIEKVITFPIDRA
ncbi:MAG: elongation factor P--(R)-beta-lysine ligase [Colwellia sp.]|nr:elongation factor P--(R)-beta-lysine ligase [Colwellia sp.]